MFRQPVLRYFFASATLACLFAGIGVGVWRYPHTFLPLGEGHAVLDISDIVEGGHAIVTADCHVGDGVSVIVEVVKYRPGSKLSGICIYRSESLEVRHGIAGNSRARLAISRVNGDLVIRELFENRRLYGGQSKRQNPKGVLRAQAKGREWLLRPGSAVSGVVASLFATGAAESNVVMEVRVVFQR